VKTDSQVRLNLIDYYNEVQVLGDRGLARNRCNGGKRPGRRAEGIEHADA